MLISLLGIALFSLLVVIIPQIRCFKAQDYPSSIFNHKNEYSSQFLEENLLIMDHVNVEHMSHAKPSLRTLNFLLHMMLFLMNFFDTGSL